MSDQYVEVRRQGFFSRLISSIVGVIFGIALFIAGFPVLWWNEGRAVQTARSLEEGAGAVVSISPQRVNPANEGKLVHLSGRATTTEILTDPVFKISANALRLRREVEMYQWVEHSRTQTRERLGGSEETITTYTYERTWTSALVDSSRFKKPEGHRNPGYMRHQGAELTASTVTLGAFTLGSGLRDGIRNEEAIPVTAEALAALNPSAAAPAQRPVARKGRKAKPVRLAALSVQPHAQLKISGDELYLGADPAVPAVGDLRIGFSRVPPTDVSIIAQQRGASFQPYPTRAGKPLQMIRTGTIGAAEMFSEAQRDNTIITWLLRLGGYLLMAFGGYTVLRPLAVTASVIPLFGALARTGLGLVAMVVAAPFALLTTAVAWIVHRPLLGAVLLALALGALVLLRKVVRRSRAAAAPAHLAAVG